MKRSRELSVEFLMLYFKDKRTAPRPCIQLTTKRGSTIVDLDGNKVKYDPKIHFNLARVQPTLDQHIYSLTIYSR